jgi:hypothetical protein
MSDVIQVQFAKWLRSRGGYLSPKLNLFENLTNGDRGVWACEDIKEGEQLLLVPSDATLHLDYSVGSSRYGLIASMLCHKRCPACMCPPKHMRMSRLDTRLQSTSLQTPPREWYNISAMSCDLVAVARTGAVRLLSNICVGMASSVPSWARPWPSWRSSLVAMTHHT